MKRNICRQQAHHLIAVLILMGGLVSVAQAAVPGKQTSAQEAARQVDALLGHELFQNESAGKANLAAMVNDTTYLRRVTLDLIGELPAPEDITSFALDPSPDKRAKAVSRLLEDRRYGQNWARYWRDVIMMRRQDDRSLLASNALVVHLTKLINENTGWDKVAHSFIEATGNVVTEGQTALILAQGGDANDIASETSRIFLGVQIQCAQCHDHPTDRWKRQQFHELAAFFPRTAIRPVFTEGRVRGFQVTSKDQAPRFRPPGAPAGFNEIEHFMPDLKDPTSKGTLVTPVFFATGQKLKNGTSDLERREALGDWLTAKSNPWFAKALVNRLWSELVGEGFYEPVDDMGPDRACSAPDTMEFLAEQFKDHDYDVKWLVSAIAATDAYSRRSRERRAPDQTPFLANYPQRLRADQIFDILTSSLGLPPAAPGMGFRGPGGGYGRVQGPRAEFNVAFAYDPSERRDDVTGSIPQALLLMNAPLVNQAIDGKSASTMLGKLLSKVSDDEEVTVELYLRLLAREPKNDELTICLDHVKQTGNRAEAFEDILWTLINRTEFIHRN